MMAAVYYGNEREVNLMQVALSELKMNVGKFVDLSETEDVVITKYDKPAAKIIRFYKEPWYEKRLPEKINSVDQLFGTLPQETTIS
jgi:antitoxin (DNA-binding transcriptional repressor) of toxin-antitoxin stability system